MNMRAMLLGCGLLLAAISVPSDAFAAVTGPDGCRQSSHGCNREQAYSSAVAKADRDGANACKLQGATVTYVGPRIVIRSQAPNVGQYDAYYKCSNGIESSFAGDFYWVTGCPANTQWNETTKTCARDCSNVQPRKGGWTRDTGTCFEGCSYNYTGDALESLTIKTTNGARTYQKFMATPTGQPCSNQNTESSDEQGACHQTEGGHTVCRKGNNTCVTSATTGNTYCAANNTGGKAVNEARTEGVTANGESAQISAPPSVTPRTGEQWVNGPTNVVTNNITNVSVTVAGVSNTGTPNPGGTPRSGDGSSGTGGNTGGTGGNTGGTGGNTGGTGGNTGGSGGDGDCEGDDCGPGGATGQVGTLYEGKGRTVAEVFGDFQNGVGNTELGGAATGFFGGCTAGGNCPIWSYDGGEYLGSLTFDHFCKEPLSALVLLAGWCVLAVASFAAFRIAVY